MEKARSCLLACLFVFLATAAVNVFACHTCRYTDNDDYYNDSMYLGNPNRPDTVWQPAHCKNGCWHEGYYIKFLNQPKCYDVTWYQGHYDQFGNWIPAHFKVPRYKLMNPGPESRYAGFPM